MNRLALAAIADDAAGVDEDEDEVEDAEIGQENKS